MNIKQTGIHRLGLIRGLLNTHACDGILITDSVDAEYISGFHSSNIFLFITKTGALLFTDFRYSEAAKAFCRVNGEWKFIQTAENGLSALGAYCGPGKILGVQSDSMPVDQFDSLKKTLKKVRLVKLGDAIGIGLIAKSASEISSVHRAARIGDKAFQYTAQHIRLAMTEAHVAAILEDACRKYGSERPSFDTIVLFGPRAALPHGRPSNVRLKKGDFILIDFGCTVDGFCSDMTRTMVAGKASQKQRDIYAAVLEAQRRALLSVRSGATAGAVDFCARSHIEHAGFGAQFGHATGHGVGKRIHEKPRIARDNATKLPVGAIITVEPGIYIPGLGGVRIEDMVVVRQNRRKILTEAPKSLMELRV